MLDSVSVCSNHCQIEQLKHYLPKLKTNFCKLLMWRLNHQCLDIVAILWLSPSQSLKLSQLSLNFCLKAYLEFSNRTDNKSEKKYLYNSLISKVDSRVHFITIHFWKLCVTVWRILAEIWIVDRAERLQIVGGASHKRLVDLFVISIWIHFKCTALLLIKTDWLAWWSIKCL